MSTNIRFEFWENRSSESHSLLTHINEFLSVRSLFIVRLPAIRYKRSAHNSVDPLVSFVKVGALMKLLLRMYCEIVLQK